MKSLQQIIGAIVRIILFAMAYLICCAFFLGVVLLFSLVFWPVTGRIT